MGWRGPSSNLVLTAYHVMDHTPTSTATGVSTWQRGADNALPARIKTSSNYQVTRLAKIEGRSRGYPEMVLLNQVRSRGGGDRVLQFSSCAMAR